jgi:hypothetical protein
MLLDSSQDKVRSGDRQFLPAEKLRQLEAYRSFVKTRKRYVILDASKPVADIAEDAYAAIIDMLARRTDMVLKNRF